MTKKNRTKLPILVTVLLLIAMLTATFASVLTNAAGGDLGDAPLINLFKGDLNFDQSQFYDGTVIYKLPDSVKDTDEISLIIQIGGISLLDAYEDMNTTQSFSEFYLTDEADELREEISAAIDRAKAKIAKTGVEHAFGVSYNTIFNGFEVLVKAGDFVEVCQTFGSGVNVIVGDVYKTEETKLVENNVNAFETGIFDTTGFGYDGSGMVVAVLDTGTDYYHTAFSTDNFTSNKLGLTYDELREKLLENKFSAESTTPGLTVDDVYISEKLPYGYDYADKDTDVFPINNHHGTHVAGIIAGKDDTITGVAPNAQIVTMKIFSDVESSARTSWIMAALEDCVALGVDVINMSIGTACGFSRETDKEAVYGVYDRIRKQGINMVVAASNSFNSAYSSEKNGNLPLTSNPDSSTVGSPSTYEGALSVASIEGAKTSYILYGSTIIYFEESTDRVSEEKNFVKELLGSKTELEIEYVVIPGAGLEADYMGIDVKGKVALIKRGSSTFEEKANVAEKMGAAAAIIYNNVSGDIKMNVGETTIPVCSISQNDGELLAATPSGTIKLSKNQAAGPFMSDFSSWGPTPDLGIKPEITAHGGSILSAVPGQSYDRISGTSMATPNITGVTALLLQYVNANPQLFPEAVGNSKEAGAIVNRLMMSTADIIYGKNGNPYAVRKQGAGLANLVSSSKTTAYILTYDRADGSVMDKSKIELGDDPKKTGSYTLVFTIDNFGKTSLSYDVSALVMAEGISETKTNQGDTTVTETSYMLGAGVTISKVSGGQLEGNTVTVSAGKQATVTLTINLTDEDKKYLNDGFENGTYVEGFVTLEAAGETVDLSVPFLAFYGDWTKAPIFDLDYYATNKDEIDDGIDLFDKTLADAYATRPIGGTYDDYVSYLGSYYYEQAPGSNKVAADRKYISLTNQTQGVNELKYVWAGLLRNVDYVEVTIVEDSTGEVVFETVDRDIRKSYGDGGPIRPANIDIGFSAIDENLKNNTKYTVTLKAYMDYGDGGVANNLSNTFTFPLTVDFEAPTLTGCEFYTEYDRSTKTTRLFAKVAIYDNHYSMAMFPGYIGYDPDGAPTFYNFDRYLTPIYSEENSTSYVTYELTDYIDEIKSGAYAGCENTFAITVYDYALNISTYQIALPAEYTDFYFEDSEITLTPNEIYDLNPILYPSDEWAALIDYKIITNDGAKYISIVNGKLVALAATPKVGGEHRAIAVEASAPNGVKARFTVKVVEPENGRYPDKRPADDFKLSGYYVDKAYYFLSSDERDIGETGNIMKFVGENYNLKMYPSEKVTIQYDLDPYYPNSVVVKFESSDPDVIKVNDEGTIEIIGISEGYASVTATVYLDGEPTYFSKTINIEIKDPWVTSGPSLSHYYGTGLNGFVDIGAMSDLAITEIGQFAFSNFDYVPKEAGDEISEESPETTKIWFIGDDKISKVVIPEGVEKIGAYAFANLTNLKEVVLPSTLTTIDYGAFYGCTKLTTVKGIENVKFINSSAFQGCALTGTLDLKNTIAIGDYAFAETYIYNETTLKYDAQRNAFTKLILSENCKSIGAYAFSSNVALTEIDIKSDFLKLGRYAFSNCRSLTTVSELNAAVIPTGTFYGCSALAKITIGKDVAQIGEYAFGDTKVLFSVNAKNTKYTAIQGGKFLLTGAGTTLALASPTVSELNGNDLAGVTVIGAGAFAGNKKLNSLKNLSGIKVVEAYAFADCTFVTDATDLTALTEVGDYAFANTRITALPDMSKVTSIGRYAFAQTYITEVVLGDNVTIPEGAFSECPKLAYVKLGNNATIGEYAFLSAGKYSYSAVECGTIDLTDGNQVTTVTIYYYPILGSALKSLELGENAKIGDKAFWLSSELTSVKLGKGAKIGNYAFYGTTSLTAIDLSGVISIGDYAFSGDVYYKQTTYTDESGNKYLDAAYDNDGNYLFQIDSSKITAIDLSSATSVGKYAFGYCDKLESVTLGEGVTTLADGVFTECTALTEVKNIGYVTKIGSYALAMTKLTEAKLDSIKNVGDFAFCMSSLASLTLGEGIESIGEGAFSYCESLSEVKGLNKASSLGEYAFAYTALKSADLSGATYIGDYAFMKETLTDFTVILGDKLKNVGDNPFALCKLDRLYTQITESFNGKDYTTKSYTYDLSDTIRIIDGSLYRVVPNGLELITYCADPEAKAARVADGTVRISAYAFAESDVVNVILPYTVRAVGHKAFFGCDKLTLVNFASYYSPMLEEEYDPAYFQSYENMPMPEEHGGIGIVDYFMWNAYSDPSNVYYGANFKNYIGKVENKAVMVKPTNGVGYDSFILTKYFDVVLEGAAAADNTTLAFVEAVNRLPEKVSLADKALVEAAAALYKKIATNEQRGLVEAEYQKLVAAQKRISDLEYLQNQGQQTPEEPQKDKFPVWALILIIVGGAAALGTGVFFIIRYARKRKAEGKGLPAPLAKIAGIFKKKAKTEAAEATEEVAEAVTEAAEEAAEATEATEEAAEAVTEEITEPAIEAAPAIDESVEPAFVEDDLPPDVPENEESEIQDTNENSEEKSEDKED